MKDDMHDPDDLYEEDEDAVPSFFQNHRTFAMIVADVMSVAPRICLECLPGGEFYRGEYMSSHPDHPDQPNSLCFNLQTGRWTDIAANAQGFEPVTYYAHVTGLSLDEAIAVLGKKMADLFDHDAPVLM